MMKSRLAAMARDEALLARLGRIAVWVGAVALLIFVLDLLGIPVSDWIRELFRKIREVPAWAVVAGVLLQTAQTTLAAAAWLGILRAAYPQVKITFRLILAAYATSVAINSFLPANIGTWVMLIMFTSVIAGATFTAMLSESRFRRSRSRSSTSRSTSICSFRSPGRSRSSSADLQTTGWLRWRSRQHSLSARRRRLASSGSSGASCARRC